MSKAKSSANSFSALFQDPATEKKKKKKKKNPNQKTSSVSPAPIVVSKPSPYLYATDGFGWASRMLPVELLRNIFLLTMCSTKRRNIFNFYKTLKRYYSRITLVCKHWAQTCKAEETFFQIVKQPLANVKKFPIQNPKMEIKKQALLNNRDEGTQPIVYKRDNRRRGHVSMGDFDNSP